MGGSLSLSAITALLAENIKAVRDDPSFCAGEVKYALDRTGEPDVKVAAANVPLDYDLWKVCGIRPVWVSIPSASGTSGSSMPGGQQPVILTNPAGRPSSRFPDPLNTHAIAFNGS